MVSLPSSAIVLRKHQLFSSHVSTRHLHQLSKHRRHRCIIIAGQVFMSHTHSAWQVAWLPNRKGPTHQLSWFFWVYCAKGLCQPFYGILCWRCAKQLCLGEVMVNINDKKESAELAFKYMLCLVLAPTTFTDRDKRGTSCKMRCGMTNVFRMWQQQQQHFGARALSHRREHCVHLRW